MFKPTAVEVNRVSIENLHLTFRETKAGSPVQFTIASLAMTRQGSEDARTLDLKADYNGQPLELAGQTGRIGDVFRHQRFPLQLSGKLANAAVRIDGAIDDVLTLQGIDLEAQLSGKNFETFGPVIGEKLPTTDQFEIQGRLTGSSNALTMKNARAAASRGRLRFTVNGEVKDFLTLSGMDLQSRLTGKNLEEFGEVIGEKLPVTDALSSLAVGPIGLLAPFVHLGAHNAHPCNIQSAGQSGLPAPPAK